MERRQGCLAGLLELFLLGKVYDWLQRNFGFGKGCSCSGCGCGCLFLILFVYFLFTILFNTDWLRPFLGW